jgi:hypothetical protein
MHKYILWMKCGDLVCWSKWCIMLLFFVVLPSSTYLFTAGVEGFDFSLDHSQGLATFGRTPLDEGSARRRDLHLTTQILYKTNIHPHVGIRTYDPSKRSAADPHLRLRGHWNRPWCYYSALKGCTVQAVNCMPFPLCKRTLAFEILSKAFIRYETGVELGERYQWVSFGLLYGNQRLKAYWISLSLSSFRSPSLFYLLLYSRCRGCYFHLIALGHTPQSVGLL